MSEVISNLDCVPPPMRPFIYEAPVTSRALVFPNVRVGAHSYINGGMVREYTQIGRYCSIAYNVSIGMGDHAMHLVSTHPFATRASQDQDHISPFVQPKRHWREPTVIGDDVWIGQNAVVCAGVKIGTGAVVAAGSVVTRDVEPYAIVGGIPAKTIRFRFPQDTRDALLASEWWMYPVEFLQTLPTNNIPKFIDLLSAGHKEDTRWITLD